MPTPSTNQTKDDFEAEVINEILDFWKSVRNPPLKQMASRAEISKAIHHWEERTIAFYNRFASRSASDSDYQVVWNDVHWKYFRSVLILSRTGAYYLYPKNYFQLQGISKSFFDQFWNRWHDESEKSLKNFIDTTQELEREILADLNLDELACIKSAPKSIDDPDTQAIGWIMPQFYAKETAISRNRLTKILHRLYGYGIIRARTYVNFARIGLKPFFFISERNLEELELDYCFFQLRSPESKIKFTGLAIPPLAVKLGWDDDAKKDGTLEPITTFNSGWNLSQLSETGWGDLPSLHIEPEKTAFGQVKQDFQTTPIQLRPSDPLYLERIQGSDPRTLRAEFGVSSQQRLLHLNKQHVIQLSPAFRSLQCGAMIFLCCQGPSTELKAIKKLAYHFPRFRILLGLGWILLVLNLPPSWVYSSLINLKEFLSPLSIENMLIDVHRGTAERYLPFSKLWDKESKEWIA